MSSTVEVSRDIAIVNHALRTTLRYPTQSAIDEALEALGRVAMERVQLTAAAPTWTPVTTLPDADTTVLLFDAEASEPVWPGYFEGSLGIWYYIDGIAAFPTHWMTMPEGPKP